MQLDPKYPLELIAYLVVNPLTANLFPPAPFSALTNHQSDNRTYVCKPKKIPVLMIWITTESSKKRKKKIGLKRNRTVFLSKEEAEEKRVKGVQGVGLEPPGPGVVDEDDLAMGATEEPSAAVAGTSRFLGVVFSSACIEGATYRRARVSIYPWKIPERRAPPFWRELNPRTRRARRVSGVGRGGQGDGLVKGEKGRRSPPEPQTRHAFM